MAVERSYLDASVITTHTTSNSLLTMPQFTSQDIDGLMRTFMLYVRFPKEEWPRIRLAEQDTEAEAEEVIMVIMKNLYQPGIMKTHL